MDPRCQSSIRRASQTYSAANEVWQARIDALFPESAKQNSILRATYGRKADPSISPDEFHQLALTGEAKEREDTQSASAHNSQPEITEASMTTSSVEFPKVPDGQRAMPRKVSFTNVHIPLQRSY